MMRMKFIDYNTIKETYTVPELCKLLKLSKSSLREKCAQFGIYSIKNRSGEEIFLKYAVCRLHNALYHADRNHQKERFFAHG